MAALSAAEGAVVALALLAALAFRPWAVLRAKALQGPWAALLVVMPFVWAAQASLPTKLPVVLSGACLLGMMFGWPLAVATLVPVAAASAWLSGAGLARALELAAWSGVLPATVALGIGMAMRRWLPKHVFVYILGRAFIGTALATGVSAALQVWLAREGAPALLTAGWLIAWGEAFLTGGLTAIFVAFRPEWLLTYSDERYLPPAPGQPR